MSDAQIRIGFVSMPTLSANSWSNLAYVVMLAGLALSVWRIRVGWWFELAVVESVMAAWGMATGQHGLIAGAATWSGYYTIMLYRYRAGGGRRPGHCACCRHNGPASPSHGAETWLLVGHHGLATTVDTRWAGPAGIEPAALGLEVPRSVR